MSGIVLGSRSVDLNGTQGEWLTNRVNVDKVQRLHLEIELISGVWTTAVVELQKTVSGSDYYSFDPVVEFSGIGRVIDIDVHDAAQLNLELTTIEGAAGVAVFHFYGDGQDAYQSEAVETRNLALGIRLDEASATVTYVGKALPGTVDSASTWQIFRMTESGGDLTLEYADGDGEFDNVWDNRASLSYS